MCHDAHFAVTLHPFKYVPLQCVWPGLSIYGLICGSYNFAWLILSGCIGLDGWDWCWGGWVNDWAMGTMCDSNVIEVYIYMYKYIYIYIYVYTYLESIYCSECTVFQT